MTNYNLARKRIERIYRIGKYILYKETLVDFKDKFWSFLGSFFGIGIIALIQSTYLTENDNVFLIGSFGASCVLIYGAVQSPLAQPRNLIVGHMVSAIIGVTVCKFLPDIIWLTVPWAVSLSIIAMQYTKSLHPPGGATALIAVIGSEKIKALGYLYIVFPVLSGVVILLSVALITNNMTSKRKYPNDGRFSRNLKWITNPISHYSQKIKVKRAD